MSRNLLRACGFQLIASYQADRQRRGDDEAFKTLVLKLVRLGLRHFVDEQQWRDLLDVLRAIQALSAKHENFYGLTATGVHGVERDLTCVLGGGKLTGQAVAVA